MPRCIKGKTDFKIEDEPVSNSIDGQIISVVEPVVSNAKSLWREAEELINDLTTFKYFSHEDSHKKLDYIINYAKLAVSSYSNLDINVAIAGLNSVHSFLSEKLKDKITEQFEKNVKKFPEKYKPA